MDTKSVENLQSKVEYIDKLLGVLERSEEASAKMSGKYILSFIREILVSDRAIYETATDMLLKEMERNR